MKHFNVLIKPASSRCNMHCTYCFYWDEAMLRTESDRGIMTKETIQNLVTKTLSLWPEDELTISYCFQGGEPLTAGLNWLKTFVETAEAAKEERHTIQWSLQTNGTLITDDIAEFFKEKNFLVGVSLDGYKALHNQGRPDAGGRGTFDRVIAGINLLKKHKVEYNILTVLTSYAAKHPDELYAFYKRNKIGYIQFIPCLAPLESESPLALTPDLFGSFYKRFFDLWYPDYIKGSGMIIGLFDNVIPMYANIPPSQCGMLGFCSPQFVLEGDGTVYPCDFYCLDKYRTGNINTNTAQELISSQVQRDFMAEERPSSRLCANCRYLHMCRGGCKRSFPCFANDDYCGYRDFLQYTEQRMRDMVRGMR